MNHGNSKQKNEIYLLIKEFYKNQAEKYTKELQRGHAIRVYEKMLEMNISDVERKEIKEKLMKLYEKTGKLKEYFVLKRER